MARNAAEAATLSIVPANEVPWEDLRAVVGTAFREVTRPTKPRVVLRIDL